MLNVVWSERAKLDYWENIQHLIDDWTILDASNFVDKVDDIVSLLKTETVEFRQALYRNTYFVPITKHITLFYQKEQESIQLLRFWNTYKNPEDLVY